MRRRQGIVGSGAFCWGLLDWTVLSGPMVASVSSEPSTLERRRMEDWGWKAALVHTSTSRHTVWTIAWMAVCEYPLCSTGARYNALCS
jgi:hypothetical protein